ncbi:MAG: RnfH family protein [Acidiferrobacterales bacterium]
MAGDEKVHVEVAYATAARQWLVPVEVGPMTSVQAAIQMSGILQYCPEIDLARDAVGKFGEVVGLTDIVDEGDRIEIYRALRIDPKTARRLRARPSRGARRRIP